MAIPHGNASIICGASYHVWDLPSVIICDDVAKDPSDRLSPLTSAKSYISKLRYLARYFPANIPWPMTHHGDDVEGDLDQMLTKFPYFSFHMNPMEREFFVPAGTRFSG